jgi:hypothetical protein
VRNIRDIPTATAAIVSLVGRCLIFSCSVAVFQLVHKPFKANDTTANNVRSRWVGSAELALRLETITFDERQATRSECLQFLGQEGVFRSGGDIVTLW